MAVIVRAASGATGLVVNTTAYLAAGPLPEGAVLRRVRVCWAIAGAAHIAIALVLVSSDEETLANLRAGRSLVTRSDASIGGRPAAAFSATVDSAGVFDIFWGLPLLASDRYLLLGMSAAGVGAAGSVVFSGEMLRGE